MHGLQGWKTGSREKQMFCLDVEGQEAAVEVKFHQSQGLLQLSVA